MKSTRAATNPIRRNKEKSDEASSSAPRNRKPAADQYALDVHGFECVGTGGERETRLSFQRRVNKMIPKMKADPENTKKGEARCPDCKFINKKRHGCKLMTCPMTSLHQDGKSLVHYCAYCKRVTKDGILRGCTNCPNWFNLQSRLAYCQVIHDVDEDDDTSTPIGSRESMQSPSSFASNEMNSNRDSIGAGSDNARKNPPEASMNEDEDIVNEAPSDSVAADRAIKQEPHAVTSTSCDEDTVFSDTGPRKFKSVAIPVEVKAEDEDTDVEDTGPRKFKSVAIPAEVKAEDEDTDVEDSASSKEEGGKEEKALKDTGVDDDDDVGALIYRKSQLRKAEAAEAAAAAAQRKKTSSDSTHHRTSTRKRSSITSRGKESLSRPQRDGASKRRLEEYSLDEEQPRQNVAKKRHKYECYAEGCSNHAKMGGVCVRHGAKVKRCSNEGCTNIALKGGLCVRHGAKVKLCSSEGCTNKVIKGGVCVRHGAKVKQCSSEGCTNKVIKGGVCKRHGAQVKLCSSEGCTNYVVKGGVCRRHGAKAKLCSSEGCTNEVVKGGVCMRHGAKVKLCSSEGCSNQARNGGVCWRHGAKINTQDRSTAFGSEFEQTAATQTLPSQRASRACARGQGGNIVPGEVTIPCREFAEV